MARIKYEDWRPGNPDSQPSPVAAAIIADAERICRGMAAQGYDLTLRQLYYQFVAHDLFPADRAWKQVGSRWVRDENGTKNAEPNYKWLGEIVNRARMAGLLDWDYIVDRTRSLYGTNHTDSPGDAIRHASWRYHIDKWTDQLTRVEIWVEKEALAGVVGRPAARWDVDYFPCKGYASQSSAWAAGRRLRDYIHRGQDVTILYLGDHDPSGIDMTRDVEDRLSAFIGRQAEGHLEVRRIALNRDQIDRYQPPPNPAKLTDSRSSSYVIEHGYESWELDALDPATLDALITEHIEGIVDADVFTAARDLEREHQELLRSAADRWDELVGYLGEAS